MTKHKQDYEPILVKDPVTGQVVDIKPFFTFLHVYSNSDTSENICAAKHSIESTLRLINLNIDDHLGDGFMMEFRNIFFYLYNIKDMFSSLTVYKKEAKT